MAITRRPKAGGSEPLASADVDALISKGGSVARSLDSPVSLASSKPISVVLRIPPDALAKVDRLVEARRVKVPRHTWLIEAIIEKLERDTEISR